MRLWTDRDRRGRAHHLVLTEVRPTDRAGRTDERKDGDGHHRHHHQFQRNPRRKAPSLPPSLPIR